MPWSGSAPSQSFTRTDGVRTGDDVYAQQNAASVNIETSLMDVHDTDFKDGINACLKKDGGNTATADIPMGGFSLTNVGQAAARTESAQFADIQDNRGQYVATVGGTADVITLTPTVAITAYAAGQRFSFIASGDNTGATTVNVSAVAAKAIVRNDGSNTALVAGDIQSGAVVDIEYDGTRFLLLSGDAGALKAINNLSDVASATTAATNLGLGTGNSPQFAGVNIGHASDTTIARTGAGDISVEGNAIYRAGGTDVPVTDGGTGASTAATARANLAVVPARAYGEYATAISLTPAIPFDDTIPQNTEGTEIITAAITLSRADSRVRATFSGFGSSGTTTNNDDILPWAAALFIDTTADALAVSAAGHTVSNATASNVYGMSCNTLVFEHAPGSVGPFTYKIRVGPSGEQANSYLFMNGDDLARRFGGVAKATLVVEEVFVT